MPPSKPVALAILTATAVPVADVLFFAVLCLTDVLAAGLLPLDAGRALVRVWATFHLWSLPWVWALVVVYWACLFRVQGMSYHRRVLWGLGLFWLSGIVMPLFWYRHLRPIATPAETPPSCAAPTG